MTSVSVITSKLKAWRSNVHEKLQRFIFTTKIITYKIINRDSPYLFYLLKYDLAGDTFLIVET